MAINFDNVMNYANQNKKKKKQLSIDNVMKYAQNAQIAKQASDEVWNNIQERNKEQSTQPVETINLPPMPTTSNQLSNQILLPTAQDVQTARVNVLQSNQPVNTYQELKKKQGTLDDVGTIGGTVIKNTAINLGRRAIGLDVDRSKTASIGDIINTAKATKEVVKKPENYEGIADVPKVILGTAGDLGLGAFKGGARIFEDASAKLAYDIAVGADIAGNKELSQTIKTNLIENANPYTSRIENLQEKVDKYSILGDTADKISDSIGYTGTLMGLNALGGNVLNNFAMYLSSSGSNVKETLQEHPNAKNWQVLLRSNAKGAYSVFTESLGGILGQNKAIGDIEDKAYTKITENMLDGAGKVFARLGIDATSEAAEEFIEYVGDQIIDLGVDGLSGLQDEKFHKDWNWEELGESMAIAFVSTLALNGTVDAVKIANIKSESKANGEKMSTKEAIQTLAKRLDLEANGQNNQGIIPDILQNAQNSTEIAQGNINQASQSNISDFNNQVQQTTQEYMNQAQNQVREQTSNIVQDLINYNNSRQEGQEIFDLNNEQNKNELSAIQKVANDRGINIEFNANRFTDNSRNAFYEYDNNGNIANIVLNPNSASKKYVQDLVVHELVHSFSAKQQEKLMKDVLNYAKTLEGFDKAYKDIRQSYEEVYGKNVSEDVINEEVVANILGQKLGSQEFINDLVNGKYSTQNRNWVQKIYDFVKNQINRFRGYKDQERYWTHIKEMFDDAYRNSEVNKGKAYSTEMKNTIQGLEDYSRDEIKQIANDYIKQKLEANDLYDIELVDSEIHGSRGRGTARADSDLDIVVEYTGDIREDDLFDILNEDPLEIDGIKVDINPITADKTGTLEEYMKRSNEYDREKLAETSSVDNQGRKLSKEQVEYFKDSKVRDEDGNLITVYHTTTDNVAQFNEFNPVGTPGYRFGEQIVNYFTDSKDMSGSYANSAYKMADTKRINNFKEANEWIATQNTALSNYEIKKQTDKNGKTFYGVYENDRPLVGLYFNNEQELIKKIKQDFEAYNEQFGKSLSKIQYEGYVNIKNPYVIDAEGKNWNQVVSKINENAKKEIDDIKKDKSKLFALMDLKEESIEKNQEYRSSGEVEEYNQLENLSKSFKGAELRGAIQDCIMLGLDYSDYTMWDDLPVGTTKLKDINSFFDAQTMSNDAWKPIIDKYSEMTIDEYCKKAYEARKNMDDYGYRYSYFANNVEKILGKELKNLTGAQLFTIADSDFSKTTINNLIGENQTTNDVVNEVIEMNKKGANYDGVIIKNTLDYGGYPTELVKPADLYVTFNSNQFKAIDNTKPTNDPDIRFSKDTSGDWNNFLEKNFKKEGTGTSIKDMKVLPTKQITMQDFEDAINEYNFPSKDANDLKNDLKYVEMNKQSLDEFKDFLRTYNEAYQETLQSKEDEALDTTKTYSTGRKEIYRNYLNDNSKYDKTALEKAKSAVPGKQGRRTKEQWLLVARQIGTEIANKSNEEIEKIAYRSWIDEAPNQKSQLNRQGEKFVKFNSDDWINAIYNQVKDVRQSYSIETNLPTAEQTEQTQQILPTKQESKLPKVQSKNSTSDIPETKLSQKQTDTEVAEIMKEPEKYNKEDRRWAIFKANLIDKGIVFENLDDQMFKLAKSNNKKAKNTRTLQSAWDYLLLSGARSQNAIAKARYEFENGKQRQTSKALTEIMDEVGEDTEDFYNYMYHQLNVDRMTLDKRIGIENKPVFGDSVTADMSKQRIAELEKKHPEFKEYAQDVYDYLKADKQELVKSGVISQELADKFDEYYPHYVPISRVGKNKNVISVPLDTKRTGVNAPIKGAKGGSSNINPLFETMANRTEQTYRASARNELGLKLKNILSEINQLNGNTETTNIDDIMDSIDDDNRIIKQGDKNTNPTFTIFDKGQKTTFDIDMNIYDALKTRDDGYLFNKQIPIVNQINNIRRGLLTEYNPIFSLTNAMKDAQDVLINSQHPAKTYAKLPESYHQILSKGYWYNEYLQNGGESNSYFKDGEFSKEIKEQENKFKKIATMPLQAISAVNNVIEMSPRLAEYIASRESGRSVAESMLDASRVTTNFKAGGDFTKFLNRNGATFLNASVQGAVQQVRNIKEANQKGFKGWLNLALRYAAAGAPVLLLNKLLWDDDDDYEELSDYIKDNYYIIAKYGDGKFIRLPKGRTVSSIQKIITNVDEYMNNKKEVNIDNVTRDVLEDLGFFWDNTAPNSVSENNIIAPFVQVSKNTSWYGEDIVPSRLQNVPEAEQYDESIDEFSKWIGQTFNVSPYKVNYLIDQYSGGLGDVLLPMSTQQAESGLEGASQLIAPLVDKFTADSTMKNQNVSDFYSLSEELTKNANSANATNEDILKNKYINRIKNNMQDLYKEKREIQNSNLGNKEKYEQVREVQKQIVDLAKEGLNNYENIKDEYGTYEEFDFSYKNPEKYKWLEDNDISYKKYQNNKEEYDYAYKNPEKYDWLENNNIDYDEYIENKDAYNNAYSNPEKYELSKLITKDYTQYYQYKKDINDLKSDGTTERKQKVINYVNSLNLSVPQKAMLIRQEYKTYNNYNSQIIQYINSLNITRTEKKQYLEELGFTVDSNFNITW